MAGGPNPCARRFVFLYLYRKFSLVTKIHKKVYKFIKSLQNFHENQRCTKISTTASNFVELRWWHPWPRPIGLSTSEVSVGIDSYCLVLLSWQLIDECSWNFDLPTTLLGLWQSAASPRLNFYLCFSIFSYYDRNLVFQFHCRLSVIISSCITFIVDHWKTPAYAHQTVRRGRSRMLIRCGYITIWSPSTALNR